MEFWALAGHPVSYRVLDCVLEQDGDWWGWTTGILLAVTG